MNNAVTIPNKQLLHWNGKDFWVMTEPECWKAYDLENQDLETYFSSLYDEQEDQSQIPSDEVNRERILRLAGMDQTLEVHFISDDTDPFIPARLETTSTECGTHEGGGMVTHDGTLIKIRIFRVEPTEASERAQFEAHERARNEETHATAGDSRDQLDCEYLFRVRGKKRCKVNNQSHMINTWHCRIRDSGFDMPDLVCSELLMILIENRGVEFAAPALLSKLTGDAPVTVKAGDMNDWLGSVSDDQGNDTRCGDIRNKLSAPDVKWDQGMIDAVLAGTKTLQHDIAECGNKQEYQQEKSRLVQQLEDLHNALRSNCKKDAQGKWVSRHMQDELSKAGNLVNKHYHKLLDSLKMVNHELWEHLTQKGCLTMGEKCEYKGSNDFRVKIMR